MNALLADVGVPMIFPQVILMAFALVPVVVIETVIIQRMITVSFWKGLKDIGLANLCTTIIGVPLAWFIMFILELVSPYGGTAMGLNTPTKELAAVTLQAAWLVPYEEDLHWMIPAAASVLLIPSFFISVFIERWILIRRWKEQEHKSISSAVFRANLLSYLLLFALGSLWTMSNLH
jgi:hypothetical protein